MEVKLEALRSCDPEDGNPRIQGLANSLGRALPNARVQQESGRNRVVVIHPLVEQFGRNCGRGLLSRGQGLLQERHPSEGRIAPQRRGRRRPKLYDRMRHREKVVVASCNRQATWLVALPEMPA